MNESLIDRIPTPEDVEFELDDALDAVRAIHVRVRELAPKGADALVAAGENLPVPDGPALLAPALAAMQSLEVAEAESLRAGLVHALEQLAAGADPLPTSVADAVALASTVGAAAARVAELPAWLRESALIRATLRGKTIDVASYLAEMAARVSARLDQVVTTDESALTRLDGSLLDLDPTRWHTPMADDLAALAAIDPLAETEAYIAALDSAFGRVGAHSDALAAGLGESLALVNTLPLLDDTQSVADGVFAMTVGAFSGGARARLLYEIDRASEVALPVALHEAALAVHGLIADSAAEARALACEDLADGLAAGAQHVAEALDETRAQVAAHVDALQQAIAGMADPTVLVDTVVSAVDKLVRAARGLVPIAEPLAGALETFIAEIAPLVSTLDTDMVAEGITITLDEAVEVLQAPEVTSAVAAAEELGQEVGLMLQRVAVAAVLERTNADLNALADALRGVDLAGLPSHLRASVSEALAQVHGLSIPDNVAGTLQAAYSVAFTQAAELVQPFRSAYARLQAGVAALEPAHLMQPVISEYRALMDDLGAIEPASSLAPVKELHERLTETVGGLAPDTLLAPLSDSYHARRSALAAVREAELLAQPAELAAQVAGTSAEASQIASAVAPALQQFTTLAGQWPTEQQVQALLDALQVGQGDAGPELSWSLTPSADIEAVRVQLDAIAAASPSALTRLKQAIVQVDAADVAGHVALLDSQWRAERDRVAAIALPEPVTEPLAGQWTYIENQLAVYDPTTRFAEVIALTDALRTRLDERRAECASIAQSAATLLATARTGVAEPLTGDFADVISALVDHSDFADMRSEALDLADSVLVVRSDLDSLHAACLRMRAAASRALSTLQDVFIAPQDNGVDAALGALCAHDPASLIGALQPLHEQAENALEQLYPADVFDNLDTRYYRDIIESLAALDPETVVLPGTTARYEELLETATTVDVGTLFMNALDALVTIEEALRAGVAQAEGLVSGLPAEVPQ